MCYNQQKIHFNYMKKVEFYTKNGEFMKINQKIRRLRENFGWTQEEMADKLNMTTQGYAKIERGDTQSNLNRLEQIAKVFGIDIVELLTYGEDSFQFNNSTNISSFNNAFSCGDSQIAQLELQKMQLIIAHQNEIIENLKRENALLLEINQVLKDKL